jgi:predicted Zn-dependent protease
MLLLGCQHGSIPNRSELWSEFIAQSPDELYSVALHHAQQGDLMRAEQYLNAARKEGYDEAAVVYWLVRVCLAAGRYHAALGHGARHLNREPSNWRLRLVVASIHEALGDPQGALTELEQVVRSHPSFPLAHYRLAQAYLRHPSHMDRAKLHLETYLALDPEGVHAPAAEMLLSKRSESETQHERRSFVVIDRGGLP